MPTFQARAYDAHPDELVVGEGTFRAPCRNLPDVEAPTAREAAELASQYYGEEDPVGEDGSSTSLEPRVVEVRAVDPKEHLVPGEWQRFVVGKRLVVKRCAEPLGELPTDWLDALRLAWRALGLNPDRRLEAVATWDAWDAQGRVAFAVRFVDGTRLRFGHPRGPATRVVRALLTDYVAYRENGAPTVGGAAAASRAEKTLSDLLLTVSDLSELARLAARE